MTACSGGSRDTSAMQKTIQLGSYDNAGLSVVWVPGFELTVKVSGAQVLIHGNGAGLLSLAQYLATLAEPSVPFGVHLHLDEHNSLEPGSAELVLERRDQ
jgi:hypothetical protein